MIKKKLHIGVLGCSSFAMRSMLPAIQDMHEEFELVAIASRSKEKAEKFADTFGVKKNTPLMKICLMWMAWMLCISHCQILCTLCGLKRV